MRIFDFITPEQNERYAENQRRGIESCDLCGKPLRNRDRYIVEDQDGDLVPCGEPYDESSASCHYIGPECAKRLKGYVYRA